MKPTATLRHFLGITSGTRPLSPKQIPSSRCRSITSPAVLLAAGLVIASANAGITLDASTDGSATTIVPGNTSVTLSGFNPLASDKLVVVAGTASGAGSVVAINSVTYNGVPLILATKGNSTATPFRGVGIYYLDKASFPGTTGNIVVTFSRSIFTSNGFDIGAFALSGTASGFDAGSSDNGTGTNGVSASVTVAQAGSFVAAVNSYGFTNPSVGMTELGGLDQLTRAYQLNVPAGAFTATFTGGNVTSVASFAPAVSGPSNFAAWQAANSTEGGIDEDHDNDGVSNGIEYFLVGPALSTGFTALPAITPAGNTFSITWTKGPGYTGAYNTHFVVESSGTLADPWTTETPGVNVTLNGNDVTYTFPLPLVTKRFARLKVTAP